jgi:hypothetical protein
VQEIRERVRSAIKNSGFTFPFARLTVNLAPADVRKAGPAFELPIALGILVATNQVLPPKLEECLIAGELDLDGEVRPSSSTLPMAIAARDAGKRAVLLPEANAAGGAVVRGIEVYPVRSRSAAAGIIAGSSDILPCRTAVCRTSARRPRMISTSPTGSAWCGRSGFRRVDRPWAICPGGGNKQRPSFGLHPLPPPGCTANQSALADADDHHRISRPFTFPNRTAPAR